jgi:pyridoxamine 5'-phosphate oxidase
MTSPVRPDPTRLPGIDIRSLDDPFARFALWWQDAKDDSRIGEPAAMSLATADEDGRPSVRIVLLRAFDARGFVFYTNLESRKGREVQARPQAALCFHWEHEHRQVRVDGEVVAVDDADADAYFASRPRDSQLSAWASDQSRDLDDEATLQARLAELQMRYGDDKRIPRPSFWGGFRVVPRAIEFWQEGPFRRHRRDRYERTPSGWRRGMLFP